MWDNNLIQIGSIEMLNFLVHTFLLPIFYSCFPIFLSQVCEAFRNVWAKNKWIYWRKIWKIRGWSVCFHFCLYCYLMFTHDAIQLLLFKFWIKWHTCDRVYLFIYFLIGTCVQVYAIWTIYVANISQLPLDFSTFMRRNYDSHGSFDERAASFWAFTEARQNNAVNPSQLTL